MPGNLNLYYNGVAAIRIDTCLGVGDRRDRDLILPRAGAAFHFGQVLDFQAVQTSTALVLDLLTGGEFFGCFIN